MQKTRGPKSLQAMNKKADPAKDTLMKAILRGDNGALRQQIARGESVNQVYMLPTRQFGVLTEMGHLPLLVVAELGNVTALKILVEAGVDVNVSDEEGYTALHLLLALDADKFDLKRRVEAVQLLINAGADVNKKAVGGHTLLHDASWTNEPALINLLLDAGADASIANDAGVLPQDCYVDCHALQVALFERETSALRGIAAAVMVAPEPPRARKRL